MATLAAAAVAAAAAANVPVPTTSTMVTTDCTCRHTCGIASKPIIQRAYGANEVQAVQRGKENIEIRAKLLKYQEENIRLKAMIKSTNDVNKRWQKYNIDRAGHIENLLATIKELQEKEAKAREEAMVRARHQRAHAENTVLRKELDECEKSYRHLNAKMDLSRQDFAEQLQILEMQMKMHKDDWEAEKREKEEANRTSEKFREETETLKSKLIEVQKQVESKKPRSTMAVYVCTCKTHSSNYTGAGFGCRIADTLNRQNLLRPDSSTIKVLPCRNIVRPSCDASTENAKLRPSPISNRLEESAPTLKFAECKSGRLSSDSDSSSASCSSSTSSSSSVSPPSYGYLGPNMGQNYEYVPDFSNNNNNNNNDQHHHRNKAAVRQLIDPSGQGQDKVKCSPAVSVAAASSKSATWKLICPKCRRVFPSNLQLQFTSHIDECRENMHTCSQ